MRKFENLSGGESEKSKLKKRSLSQEEVHALTKDTGSSIPFRERRHFDNLYINTTPENRDKRICELHDEKIGSLEAEREDEADVSTKLSIIRQLAGIHVHHLYNKLDDYHSATREALEIRSEILETFQIEENQLEEISEEDSNPAVRAFIATRNLELKKMEVELKIRWKEKEIYELQLNDGSPEKVPHQNEVDALKFDSLRPILEETISAIQTERDILLASGASMDWSERLGYVTGRQIELERSLRDLNATKEK